MWAEKNWGWEADRRAILITVLWWVSVVLKVGDSPQVWTLKCLDDIMSFLHTRVQYKHTYTLSLSASNKGNPQLSVSSSFCIVPNWLLEMVEHTLTHICSGARKHSHQKLYIKISIKDDRKRCVPRKSNFIYHTNYYHVPQISNN